MVIIKNFKIAELNKTTEYRNYDFDKGIHYLKPDEKSLIEFLFSKEKTLPNGEFLVDGVNYFSNKEENTKSVVFLMVNSQNIRLISSFVFEKEQVEKKIEEVQQALINLKELPIETVKEKQNKIDKILSVLLYFNVSFIALDECESINSEFSTLQHYVFEKYKNDISFIVYPNEEVMSEEHNSIFMNNLNFDILEVGGGSKTYSPVAAPKKITDTANKTNDNISDNADNYLFFEYKLKIKQNKFTSVLNFIFRNFVVLFFLILSYVGFNLVFLLTPQYFNDNNGILGTMFIILGCVFLGLFIYNLYSCYDFVVNENNLANKKKMHSTVAINFIIPLISTGLSILLYFLFVNSNNNFEIEVYSPVIFVLLGIALIFVFTFPIFVKKYYKLFKIISQKISDD